MSSRLTVLLSAAVALIAAGAWAQDGQDAQAFNNPFGDAPAKTVARYKLVCLDVARVQDTRGPWFDEIEWEKFPNKDVPAIVVGVLNKVEDENPFAGSDPAEAAKKTYSYQGMISISDPKLFKVPGGKAFRAKIAPGAFDFNAPSSSNMDFQFQVPQEISPFPAPAAASKDDSNPFGAPWSVSTYSGGKLKLKLATPRKTKNNGVVIPESVVSVYQGSYEMGHRLYCRATKLKAAPKQRAGN
jgi:hypothetical protein